MLLSHLPLKAPIPQGDASPCGIGGTPPPRYLERLADLGVRLGDDHPRSSVRRAKRLLAASGAREDDFLGMAERAALETHERLGDIDARLPDGRTRGMPYFFATLERLLAGRGERAATTRQQPGRGAVTAHGKDRAKPEVEAPAAPGAERGHPLWALVREELRGTLPAPVFAARVLPLRVCEDDPGALVIEAASEFERAWLARVLAERIDQALRALERPDVEVRIGVVAA